MNDLMRKTKRELIELIQDIEGQTSHLEEKNSALEAEKSQLEGAMAALRAENGALQAQLGDFRTVVDQLRDEGETARRNSDDLQEERQRLEAAMAMLQKDHARVQGRLEDVLKELEHLHTEGEAAVSRAGRLQEEVAVATREKSLAAAARATLESALAEIREQLAACESRYQSHYELFRSFVDDDRKKILLLDTAYAVVYANRAARPVLGIGEDEVVDGKRFFDFMPFKDAIKVKEKIDKAFLSGETEKIKHVRLQGADGAGGEFKLKMSRVRHQDRPSVKIVVK